MQTMKRAVFFFFVRRPFRALRARGSFAVKGLCCRKLGRPRFSRDSRFLRIGARNSQGEYRRVADAESRQDLKGGIL